MRPPTHFLGFVDDMGKFAWDTPGAFKAACQHYKGEEVLITMKKKPRWQGTQSMRYYRGIVIPDIAFACGHEREDEAECETIHQHYAWKYLRISDHPVYGYPRRRSTNKGDLSQQEMSEYIDKVIRDAETTIEGCTVRRPHEVDMDKVYAPEAA